ncbi:protein translocase subunit SecD [Shewanella sp. C32]|uniref:Protein translocase subunit SecD n=1 Tax=Shewanella electrica TaxID=515560 RepID=A0ABT2FIL7_9GAMM|nr:protein translocase subunit SecD [Shewanella electrica]MCH1924279.1 protein translocase subunit SecD [Shewanella electrica]MCS4556182.1 protein translocase subunit SecD [Shewanella electrica]
MLIDPILGASHKRRPAAVLNHYAKWKYLVLIVTLIIMALSALPTWFGEDSAIQIPASAGLRLDSQAIATTLQQHQIALKRLDASAQKTLVVLDDPQQQTKAKAVLAGYAASPDKLALALTPAAPSWLLNLGFSPIKLGLDLRGGVQFLLDVDVMPVYQQQGEALTNGLQEFLRSKHLPAVTVRTLNDASLQLNVTADTSSAIRSFLTAQYPQWQVRHDGEQLLLQLIAKEQDNLRNETVQQNLQIMRSRIEELGITEALVQRQGENRIRIELPGVQDPAAAKDVIGATATLAFYEVSPRSVGTLSLPDNQGRRVNVTKQPVITGAHILDARSGAGEMGQAEVNITLDAVGGKQMTAFSKSHLGKPMATAFSEYARDAEGKLTQRTKVISVATIQSVLPERFRITGVGSHQDAQQLALLLRAGSMTAPVTIVEERTIGPSLGAENIHNGFAALALGMAVTLLFMALWYRRLGWVANVALLANMVLLFGLMALIPGAVLTLPGIAGLVLTVGMAVDTNVLIFERIRDKLAEGRSLAHAIDRGFDSAFSTIFDANFTTMITAVVLYSIGNGPIRGFALTLGLGLLTSMFTGIFASRAIINLAYGRNFSRDVRI